MDDAKVINAPNRIYLQIGDDFDPGDVNFNELTDVTWCADNIHETDLPYVAMPTPSAIEAWAALIANGLLGQASEEDVREVELKIYELLGVGT